MKFCSNCGYKLDDSGKFCPKCGAKAEQIDEPNCAENNSEKPIASYQQFTPATYGTTRMPPTSKIISIIAIVAAFFSLLFCFLPFLEVSFFGSHSYTVLDIITETFDRSKYQYLALGGIAAIIGATVSLLFTVGSLAKSNSLIGSITFSIVGIIGAVVAVSDDFDNLAIGFVAYELLSVVVIALSIAALNVKKHEQPIVFTRQNIPTIKDKTLYTVTAVVLTVAVVAAILLSILNNIK